MSYKPVPKLTNGNATFNNDVSVSGLSTAGSGLLLVDLVPASTTNKLYNDGGTLKFNGSAVGGGGSYDDTYLSGIAVYSSGQAIANESDIVAVSGIAAYASGEAGGGGGSSLTAGSGIVVDGDDRINIHGGTGNLQELQITSDNTFLPNVVFTGSGVTDTPVTLEVRSSFQSATGSGTALLFQGTQGQLFSITDNLSSGTIFNVSDITGLPMLEVTASGDVEIGEFADTITIHQPVLLSGGVPSDTTNKLYNDAGTLKFNGSAVGGGGSYDDTYLSGIAVYSSGQAIANESDIVAVSGIAAYASGEAGGGGGGSITVRESDGSPSVSSVSTIVVSNGTLTDDGGGQVTITTGGGGSYDDTYLSGIAVYSSGQAIANESDIVAVSGIAAYASGEAGGGGGSSLTAGSGIIVDGSDRINIHSGTGNFQEIQLNSANTFTPKMVFTGSGVQDTPIRLKVLSNQPTPSTSGTALSFEGTEGQLFGITDNLSSGNIFSVNDITGLPLISADASGDVKLGEYGRYVGVGSGVPEYGLDVSASGRIQKGVTLSDYVPAVTTNTLYNDGGTLTFNGSAVGGASLTAGSGLTLAGSEFNIHGGSGHFHHILTDDNVVIGQDAGRHDMADTYGEATGKHWGILGQYGECVLIGHQAGSGLSKDSSVGDYAYDIIGIGRDALLNSTAAIETVAIGSRALQDAVISQECTAVGALAGDSSQQVKGSTFIGYNAGRYVTSSASNGAEGNIAIGRSALYGGFNMEQGKFGVYIGRNVGYEYREGDYAIAIGYEAGRHASGVSNIFVGRGAGYRASGVNNIEVVTNNTGGSVLYDVSNKLHIENTIIGDTSSKLLAIGNVTSSDLTPDATLEVKPNATTDVGIIVQAVSSHSASLQEWQNSSETKLLAVGPDGGVELPNNVPSTTTNKLYNDGGTLKFNGSAVGGASLTAGSGITIDGADQINVHGGSGHFINLDVEGAFTATTKSFLIDHPSKEGMRLQYASLEGPENGVYVRGTTDKGFITLPDYWRDLVDNDSITVTLTPVGQFQPLFIEEKSNREIRVGGVSGHYDYVVYGERKDVDKLEVEW